MLDAMISKIKTLPPLPKSFHEINAVCSHEDPNVNELARVIEKDPMLVANLLKIANSPLYCFTHEIKTVLQAVSLFGMTATRSFCTSISAKQLLKIDIEPYGVTPEEFAAISNSQGALANAWYSKINLPKKDLLFLCALMQEVGKIFIADEVVRNNETTQFKSEIEMCMSVEQVEKSFTNVVTAEVTAAIFEHWKFDEEMVDAIRLSRNPVNSGIKNQEAIALFVIRKALPVNAPFSERSVNVALNVLERTDLDVNIFKNTLLEIKAASPWND